MEEQAGGLNHGRGSSQNPEVEGRSLSLNADEWQSAAFMRGGGWSIVTAHERGWTVGMHAHRGVLHEDEYIDPAVIEDVVETAVGFTLEQLHSVYSTGGRIPSARVALRDAIDARLLDLARGGANMDLFGRITGLNGSTLDRALARARSQEGN